MTPQVPLEGEEPASGSLRALRRVSGCRRCRSRSSLAAETRTAAGGGGSWGPHAGSRLPPSLPTRRSPRPRPARVPNRRPLTPALGGAPQELSGCPVVDEELPLGQALVEGLLVCLRHGVCADGERSGGRGGGSGEEPGGASRHERRSPAAATEGATAEETFSLR